MIDYRQEIGYCIEMKNILNCMIITIGYAVLLFFPSTVSADFTDKYASEQQGYFNIINYIPFLPNINIKGEGVIVAVIDDGVWQEHPDLIGSNWLNKNEVVSNGIDDDNNGYIDDYYGWNFIDNNTDVAPKGSHGTAVAGIIAAKQNDIGIAGIAPNSKIMSLVVCSSDGCPRQKIITAIRYATDNGANVINLSLGTSGYVGYAPEYNEVIKYAYEKGVVIVVSSGNGDPSSSGQVGQDIDFIKVSLASNDLLNINSVIGVGALNVGGNNNGLKTNWSNYGTKYVDIFAPGEEILSTVVPEFSKYGYDYLSGTSFSSPMVAASAALIKGKFPALKNYQIIDMILSSRTSKGTLDVKAAVTNSNDACVIPDVDIKINNGEKIILSATHLTPRLSVALESKNINNALKILDANHLEIDTVLVGLPSGQYSLSTTDKNLYCTIQNIKITLIGSLSTKTEISLPSLFVPPQNITEKPEEKTLSHTIPVVKKSEIIQNTHEGNASTTTSANFIASTASIDIPLAIKVDANNSSDRIPRPKNKLYITTIIIFVSLLLLSNLERLKKGFMRLRK